MPRKFCRAAVALPAAVAAAIGVIGVAATPAASAPPPRPFPQTIALPNGFAPEGIDAGRGTTFFVGSLAGGAIYRGDLRTGSGEVLVPADGKAPAVGVFYEQAHDRLWVAGGPSGLVRVYDATTAALLATYDFSGPANVFLNDVAVTRQAAYVTDSLTQRIAVVPLLAGGELPVPEAAYALPLTGDITYTAGFNANGIVATPGGDSLIIVQTTTASLFRVDPATGRATTIALTGGDVAAGDGLELHGGTLYVVQNQLNRIAVIDLDAAFASGTILDRLTDPDLDVPTTVTDAAGRLWAVNARFVTPVTPETEYDVVQLPRR